MRIGMYYKWFKEGKIDCTQAEMSALWKRYENLSYYSQTDREIMENHDAFLKMLHHPDLFYHEGQTEEEYINDLIETKINHLNTYFQLMREGKGFLAEKYLG